MHQGRGRSIDFDDGVRATLRAFSWREDEIADLFDRSLVREKAAQTEAHRG